MRIHYLHHTGGHALSAPSGAVYPFLPDEQGRRVAEVEHPDDAAWFLAQTGHAGKPLFAALETAPQHADWDPARKNYDEVSRDTLRDLYARRFGTPPGNRAKNETLIEALRQRDEEEEAAHQETGETGEAPDLGAEDDESGEDEPGLDGVMPAELEPLTVAQLAGGVDPWH
jgi:hypothetical protein